jgi:hypothetical protein
MTASIDLDALCGHQELDLGILTRGVAALEQGPAATVAAASRLPKELGDALRAYQIFKHERIFDPTIASGDEQRAQMRRHMKIACISAGEVFRAHLGRWDMAAIVADWARYKPPARLTANQLHRHIRTESDGIADQSQTYS